jgi:hypothetical protein
MMNTELDHWVIVPEDIWDFWENVSPDALLAGQEPRNGCTPDGYALLWAVLRQAVLDLKWTYAQPAGLAGRYQFGAEQNPTEMREEVTTWFREESDDNLYSFNFICEALGLDTLKYRQAFELVDQSWALTNGQVPDFSPERRSMKHINAQKIVAFTPHKKRPRRLSRLQVSGKTRGVSLHELMIGEESDN